MTAEIAIVAVVLSLMIVGLILEIARPDLVVACALVSLLLTNVLSTEEALRGFANEGMLTVGLLFAVAGAVEQHGGLNWIVSGALGPGRRPRWALLRLMGLVSALSSFLNNTPVVVMFTPLVRDWCRQYGISPSKFLLPLSYATIFGGTLTLVGTSTNLVVHGIMLDHGFTGFSMFTLAVAALPALVLGTLYLVTIGYRLLPERKTAAESFTEHAREYLCELVVEPDSPLIDRTVEEAGLRNLPGVYLIEIIRGKDRIGPVSSYHRIEAFDRLIFTGMIDTIVQLQNQRGLRVETGTDLKLEDLQNGDAQLLEAVVSHQSSLINRTIKESRFRTIFGAGIVAVHRNQARIRSKVGDIVLRPGDTLLLLADRDFKARYAGSNDFYVISPIQHPRVTSPRKALIATGTLLLMVLLAAFNVLTMFKAAVVAVIVLLLTRTLTFESARKAVHLNVLLLIACAIGVGTALEKTGAAALVANQVVQWTAGAGAVGTLVVLYLMTNLFTEIITNNAAAVLMAPIALATAQKLGVDPTGFLVSTTIAASASFATPIGYQTNLIVYGPGGYRFSDYLRVGLPLNGLYLVVTTAMVSLIWL